MTDNAEVKAFLDQAQAYQAKSDYENAERSLLMALEASAQIYADPRLIAESLKQLAAFYSQMDQYSEAIAQADWAIQIVKKKMGDQHPALEPLYHSMADLQRCEGNEEESARYEKLAASVHA